MDATTSWLLDRAYYPWVSSQADREYLREDLTETCTVMAELLLKPPEGRKPRHASAEDALAAAVAHLQSPTVVRDRRRKAESRRILQEMAKLGGKSRIAENGAESEEEIDWSLRERASDLVGKYEAALREHEKGEHLNRLDNLPASFVDAVVLSQLGQIVDRIRGSVASDRSQMKRLVCKGEALFKMR